MINHHLLVRRECEPCEEQARGPGSCAGSAKALLCALGESAADSARRRAAELTAQGRRPELREIAGGTPYDATTIAGLDGSRQPSENEVAGARYQGRHVAEIADKIFG